MNELSYHTSFLLKRYMLKKREELPLFSHDRREALSTFVENGVPRPHITLVLRTSGCRWLKTDGGCTMCGFAIDSLYPYEVGPQDVIAQFEGEMKKYANLECPLTVSIFNNGSFFDPEDMPPAAGWYILERLAQDDRVQEVRIETRPEFVNPSSLKEAASLFGNAELHVAIGLEVLNDEVRRLSIHKGFTYNDFLRAAKIIGEHVYLDVYLLFKPPFLTEGEALLEMKSSLTELGRVSPSAVYVTPCKVFPTTLLWDLEERGLHTMAWSWSLLEIAKTFNSPFRLFLVNGDPVKEEPCGGVLGARNCGTCDEKVKEAIDYFNRNQKLPPRLPACTCKKEWEIDLAKPAPPLEERVRAFIEEVI